MDTISFRTSGGDIDYIVNGRNFIEIVRDFELPLAKAEGAPSIAGGYAALPVCRDSVSRLYPCAIEETDLKERPKKTCLLVCNCGEESCWPLLASVLSFDTVVMWNHFEQPYRSQRSKTHWIYGGFGPFVFERAEYLNSLSALKKEIGYALDA